VLEKLKAYLEEVDLCGSRFRECMMSLLDRLEDPENEGRADLVHHADSKADDLRRQIEFELHDRALIPESRGDLPGLLETRDYIPGTFRSLCEQVYFQHIVFPEFLRERYLRLNDSTESESDRIERGLIRDIFPTRSS
jgi:uncharacterized protein Yka (UPF0111/DUF47 family)